MGNKILVIDDDTDFQDLIGEVLAEYGFESVAALNAAEGLEALAADPDVGLLILDVMMPGMDGYEVCRKIKESEATALPIIFLSAKTQPEDIQRAYDAGGDDYIVKPFDNDRLIETISRTLADRPL
ncbi:MAG: DNA-binding response regulator [Actinobacteria bacterium]|nr:MAG: DNA-binding response regulator [Actinomycetota bacterium]